MLHLNGQSSGFKIRQDAGVDKLSLRLFREIMVEAR